MTELTNHYVALTEQVDEQQGLLADVVHRHVSEDGLGESIEDRLDGYLGSLSERRSMSFSFRRADAPANFVSIVPCLTILLPRAAFRPIEADSAAPNAAMVIWHERWSMVRGG